MATEKLPPSDILPRHIDDNFWEKWGQVFVEFGYDPKYIAAEMNRYQEHEQVWPEGQAMYRVHLNHVFTEIVSPLLQNTPTENR